MPELPEVETVCHSLQRLIVGKRIEDVTVSLPRIIQLPDEIPLFQERLRGTTVVGIGRRGKFLKIDLSPWMLVSHLRMEGKYRMASTGDPIAKHTHVIFRFEDGSELRYLDVRQFGTMHLFPKGEELSCPPLSRLGPEPLSDQFTLSWFMESLRKRKTAIKSLLLNQTYLVGLGNIYVDEALFLANIHPMRSPSSLTDAEITALFHSIRQTLSKAIDAGGSSIRSYVNGHGEMGYFQQQLQVYGRKHQPCHRCQSEIQRIKVAGRGTHFCPQCQLVME